MSIPSLEAMCTSVCIKQSLPLNNLPAKLKNGIKNMEIQKLTGRYRVMSSVGHITECGSPDMWNRYKDNFTDPRFGDIAVIKSSSLATGQLRLKHFSVYDDQQSYTSSTARYNFNTWKYEYYENDEKYFHIYYYSDNGFFKDVLVTDKASGKQELLQTSLTLSKSSKCCILKHQLEIDGCCISVDHMLNSTPNDKQRIEDFDTEDEEIEDEGGIGGWQNHMI